MGCISVYSQGIHARRANSYGVHSGCFARYSLDVSVRETHWGEVTAPKGPSPPTEPSTSRHDELMMNKAKLSLVRFCRFFISDTPIPTPLVSILSTALVRRSPFTTHHHQPSLDFHLSLYIPAQNLQWTRLLMMWAHFAPAALHLSYNTNFL